MIGLPIEPSRCSGPSQGGRVVLRVEHRLTARLGAGTEAVVQLAAEDVDRPAQQRRASSVRRRTGSTAGRDSQLASTSGSSSSALSIVGISVQSVSPPSCSHVQHGRGVELRQDQRR